MTLVATLIASPSDRDSAEAALDSATATLTLSDATLHPVDWLAPREAVDLPFEGPPEAKATALLAEALQTHAVDFAVQDRNKRRKRLLVADLESTIIGQEMLDSMAEAADLGPAIADITARTMAGELGFAEALRARVALLEGLPESLLETVAQAMTLNPGADTLIATLRKAGVHTALVTGGFGCFARPIAERCGFDSVFANELCVDGGVITGRVAAPLLDRDAKLQTLKTLAEDQGLSLEQTSAIGDGANDVAMLSTAGLGVAYRGKAPARAAAKVCLDHGDLTALLFLQGLRRIQFVSGIP